MAEIKIGNAKYETIDDKTASAETIDSWSETTFQKTVKIEGKEYTVTRLGQVYRVKNIPDSVTSIGELLICSNITIPDSVTSIGELSTCSDITIPDTVTSIGSMWGCFNMKINFPKGIKSLYPISGLKGITIPDSVTSIRSMNYCSDITIPDSVTSMGYMTNCSNISIPDSITMLDGLYRSTLTIPASVTTIKEISGEGGTLCLRMENATPPVLAKATNLAKDDVLIVPEGATEAYKKHPAWGKFKNISEDPRLNKDSAPASKGNAGSNKEISELKKELNELRKDFNEFRKDIANLMKLHKELREDFEELKKKD